MERQAITAPAVAQAEDTAEIDEKAQRPIPFDIDLLESSNYGNEPRMESYFPATYCTNERDIALINPNDTECVLSLEFSLDRLTHNYDYLWLAGLPMPPRPLHYQIVLKREIIINEKLDMHLVWGNGRIFLKPIPRYLLSTTYWRDHLQCQKGCSCSRSQEQCSTKTLRSIALGFLLSYAALLSHESDFIIAKDKGLLPKIQNDKDDSNLPKWSDWRKLVEEILKPATVYENIHKRFYYGELRLNRLNAISMVSKRELYMNQWPDYISFLRDQLGWLTATTIYIALVLTAMQAGLATDQLRANDPFMAASYGFTIFAIMGPLVAGAIILIVLGVLIIVNWNYAKDQTSRRFKHIERSVGGQA